MAVERLPTGTSLIDVLDRVLDKGVVMDAWERVSLVGIDLITVEARVVVASMHTSLKFGSAASSRSAIPSDDDDGGPEGSGSSGAPALVEYPLTPRRRTPTQRDRTRPRR